MRHVMAGIALVLLGACDDGQQLTDSGTGEGPPPDVLLTDAAASSALRLLLLVDSSGSMDYSDPADAAGETQVQRAVKELWTEVASDPSVSLTIIRYNATILVNGGASEEITRDASIVGKAIDSLDQHETMSDVEGALTTAGRIIERDLNQLAAAERAQTRYVVVLLADGEGQPACTDGCDNDPHPTVPKVWSWCDLPRSEWCPTYMPGGGTCDMESWFQGLVQCKAYNNDETVVRKTSGLVGLATQHGALGLRVDTMFLASLGSQTPEIQKLMGFDEAAAENQLKQVAQAGKGVYKKYAQASELTFEISGLSP